MKKVFVGAQGVVSIVPGVCDFIINLENAKPSYCTSSKLLVAGRSESGPGPGLGLGRRWAILKKVRLLTTGPGS